MSEFEGVARLGITTTTYLSDPESGFFTTHLLNQKGYNLAFELHPYHTPGWLKKNGETLLNVLGKSDKYPIPSKVDSALIDASKVIYPHAQVNQVHLPFAFDFPQAFSQVIKWGINSPAGNIHHSFHLLAYGWAKDGWASQVIKTVDDQDLVVNVHEDVFRKSVRRGQEGRLFDLGKLTIEDYKNPPKAIKELVEPFGVGFNLGLDHTDHMEAEGLSLDMVLKDEGVRKYTTVMHLAALNHGKLSKDDLEAKRVLGKVAATPFRHPVTAYLDFHPAILKGMDFAQQLDFWRRQLDFIKSTQPQLA